MPLYHTLKALHAARETYTGNALGVVPTMGALHKGHLALIAQAHRESEHVWVTIFVNPTQFDKQDDLEKYPVSLEDDVASIYEIDPNINIFAPAANEMYPEGLTAQNYPLDGLDTVMEGADRPGHFNGVITIVSKLFNALRPNRAYFGEKDFQQLQVIRNWAKKYRIETAIIGCPIVREANGLAMSSRNELLSKEARSNAGFIYQVLSDCAANATSLSAIESKINTAFAKQPNVILHYALCVNEKTLQEVSELDNKQNKRLFVAASVEGVRLIDNIALK